jgi:hypothetical protein
MGKARLHGLLVDKQEQIQRPNVSFQMILPKADEKTVSSSQLQPKYCEDEA